MWSEAIPSCNWSKLNYVSLKDVVQTNQITAHIKCAMGSFQLFIPEPFLSWNSSGAASNGPVSKSLWKLDSLVRRNDFEDNSEEMRLSGATPVFTLKHGKLCFRESLQLQSKLINWIKTRNARTAQNEPMICHIYWSVRRASCKVQSLGRPVLRTRPWLFSYSNDLPSREHFLLIVLTLDDDPEKRCCS